MSMTMVVLPEEKGRKGKRSIENNGIISLTINPVDRLATHPCVVIIPMREKDEDFPTPS